MALHKGTVKWFNPTKGYGFIKPNGGDKDVFVHISAVERAGLTTLNENQVVEYDLVENRGKASAENLKVSYEPMSRSPKSSLCHPRPCRGILFLELRGRCHRSRIIARLRMTPSGASCERQCSTSILPINPTFAAGIWKTVT